MMMKMKKIKINSINTNFISEIVLVIINYRSNFVTSFSNEILRLYNLKDFIEGKDLNFYVFTFFFFIWNLIYIVPLIL